MAIVISSKILQKLEDKHSVTDDEIDQCFSNRNGSYLSDTREDHKSDPPTLWFISETDYGRRLKVVFIFKNGDVNLRTAYEPNKAEIRIYNKFAIK